MCAVCLFIAAAVLSAWTSPLFPDTQHKSNGQALGKGTGCTLLDSFTLIIQERDKDCRRTCRNFSLVWKVSRIAKKIAQECLSALGA